MYCIGCGTKIESSFYFGFCRRCFHRLEFIRDNRCLKCGRKTARKLDMCVQCRGKRIYYDRCFSVFVLNDFLKNAVWNFKYGGKASYGYYFAAFLTHRLKDELSKENFSEMYLTYVPLTIKKRFFRGFNQSFVLSEQVSKRINFAGFGKYLKKLKDNKSQTELNINERKKNVEGVFGINGFKSRIKDKSFVVVDDIFTTGSTLNECARVLKRNGAKRVFGLTVASGFVS